MNFLITLELYDLRKPRDWDRKRHLPVWTVNPNIEQNMTMCVYNEETSSIQSPQSYSRGRRLYQDTRGYVSAHGVVDTWSASRWS